MSWSRRDSLKVPRRGGVGDEGWLHEVHGSDLDFHISSVVALS